MPPTSPNDPATMAPGQRQAGGPMPAGQPAPLDSGVQRQLDRKAGDEPPLHAPSGAHPREAAPDAGDLPEPDSALEGLGKAITSPIRSAADEDEDEGRGQPTPGAVRP